MKIKWRDNSPEDDGTYDLCGRAKGQYVDIIRSESGKWSVYFANKALCHDFNDREDARQWAEANDLLDLALHGPWA
jgi:hypothetical protein